MKSTEDYLADLVAHSAVTNERLGQIAADIERMDESMASFRREVRSEINHLVANTTADETRQNGAIQTNKKKLPESPNLSKKWPFDWHD